MHGLFRTDGRTGPISAEVARLWRAPPPGEVRTAALGAYFPRSSAVPEGSEAEVSAITEPAEAVRSEPAPLPPPRPADLSAPSRKPAGGPLDLSAFMKWRKA